MNNQEYIVSIECPIDGGKDFSLCFTTTDKFYGGEATFYLLKCSNCNLIVTYPCPENLFQFYYEDYYSFNPNEKTIKEKLIKYFKNPHKIINATLLKITTFLESIFFKRSLIIIKGGKMLDIGCGYGEFLYKVKRKGMEPFGIEPGCFNPEFSKKHGLNIFNGTLLDANYPSNYFDIVTLNHSFEHIPNPIEILREIYRITKPGGYIVCQVPNNNSLTQKIFRHNWYQWDVPRHLFHYTSDNLKKIFEKIGFCYQKTRYLYSGYALTLSLENYSNSFRRKKIILNNSKLKNNGCLRLLGLFIFGIPSVLVKQGDAIEMIVRKPKVNGNINEQS